MGRGENNLLFNPPKIRREQKIPLGEIAVLGSGRLPYLAHLLLPDKEEGLSLQRKEKGGPLILASFLGSRGDGQKQISHQQQSWHKEGKDVIYSLTPEGFLWLRDEMLCFLPKEEISSDANPDLYPLNINGDIFAIHGGEKQFSYLWQEKETDKIYLSAVAKKGGLGGMSGHDLDFGASHALFENKGESSVVFFAGIPREEAASLLTIHPDGFGSRYILDEHADRALWQGGEGENLISPAKEDGTYFYFDNEEGSLCFLDLKRGNNDIVAHDVDLNENRQIGEIRDLASSEDRVLLLKKGELAFYDRFGLVDRVALGKDYTNVSFVANKALLWSKWKKDYLEIAVSR